MTEGIKRSLLYVIIPALVAGAFAITPAIYEQITAPKPGLSYRETKSLSVKAVDGYRKIYSVAVQNAGKTPLSVLRGELILPEGKFVVHEISTNEGFSPRVEVGESSILISAERMHPKDFFELAVIAHVPRPEITPSFNVRTNEIIGEFSAPEDSPDARLGPAFLGAIFATISVFLMSGLVLFRFRSRKAEVFSLDLGEYTLEDKSDTIRFILAQNGITSTLFADIWSEKNVTYLRVSDLLLAEGLNKYAEERTPYVRAQKCLVLVKDINKGSLDAIRYNLRSLEGDEFLEVDFVLLRERAIGLAEGNRLRAHIREFLHSPANFLGSVDSIPPNHHVESDAP